MRIGIDFDNTIANYDGVFHAAALERGLIPSTLGTGKNDVRDHLNDSGQRDVFTELQGYVYGARMDLARVYEGFGFFVKQAREAGHELFVISHKTRVPMMGPAYDMHQAARGFLAANGLTGEGGISPENTWFELTKQEKVARAAALNVHAFIDDLPEILAMPGLPKDTKRILFDPVGHHLCAEGPWRRAADWSEIAVLLLDAS